MDKGKNRFVNLDSHTFIPTQKAILPSESLFLPDTKFGESKYDEAVPKEYFNPDYGDTIPAFERSRSEKQSGLAQLGAGVAKGIIGLPLGVAQGASVLLDPDFYYKVGTGNFDEYKNSVSDAILNSKESINSNFPVYRTKASEGFSPLTTGWYADMLPSAIEAASLMIPGYGIIKGISLLGKVAGGAKLLKTVGTLMGVEGRAISQGLSLASTASLSRMNEQYLQATDAAKNWLIDNKETINPNTIDPETGEGVPYTDDELKQMSGEIANQTFYSGLPLVALDLLELNTIFKGFNGYKAARKANLDKSIGTVAKRVALGEVLPESFDEAVQFIQEKEAVYEQDVKTKKVKASTFNDRLGNYLQDPELWTAAFAGGLGGAMMYAGGRILARREDKIKDRTQNQAQDIAAINDAVIKGDKQAFHKESDHAFAKAVVQHIQDGTIDDFRENLDKLHKTENEFLEGDDFNDKDFYKRLKSRIASLDIMDRAFYDIQNDTEVPNELKSVKLSTILDQRLTQARINHSNTDLQSLIQEDIQSGFNPLYTELKKAQGEYFAIVNNDRSSKKQKEAAGKKLDEAYKVAVMLDPIFEDMTLEEAKDALSNELITANSEQIDRTIASIHDDTLDINEAKQALADIAKDPKKVLAGVNTERLKRERIAKKQEKEAADREFKKNNPDKIEVTEEVANPFEGADSNESGDVVSDPIDILREHEAKVADIERRRQEELNNLGQKQVTHNFKRLEEDRNKSPKAQLSIIGSIELAQKAGVKLTKEQQNKVDSIKAKLKKQGYEVIDLLNTVLHEGTIVINGVIQASDENTILNDEQIKAVEQELENRSKREAKLRKAGASEEVIKKELEIQADTPISVVQRIIKPQVNKDDKLEQAAEVATLIIEANEAQVLIDKSKLAKKESYTDKINAKYDKEIADLSKEAQSKELVVLSTEDGVVADLTAKEKENIQDSINDVIYIVKESGRQYNPQGKVIRLGALIVEAAHSIAYLSKKYTEEVILNKNRNKIILSDTEDTLNDQMQEKLLLSSTKYQVGDTLFIEVDTAFNLVKEDNSTLTYEQHKNDALRVPMKITNSEGKTVGYLHDIDWITHESVADIDNNVENQRKLLTQLRYSIFDKGKTEVKINGKSYGHLSTSKEGDRSATEAIQNKDIRFAVGKNNQLWTGLEDILPGEQPINSEIQSGMTYMIVDTPVKGKTIALPLFNTKVTQEVQDTLYNATEAFYTRNKAIADEVLKNTGHDILTASGLADFFNLFISTGQFDQQDLNAKDSKGNFNANKLHIYIAGSGIKFGTGGNPILEMGNEEYWNKYKNVLKDTLGLAYASVFLKHLAKPTFKYSHITNDGKVEAKESTYQEYIKSITTTNIVEHKIGENEYSYFVQPTITFTTNVNEQKQIEEHKVDEVLVTTKPTETTSPHVISEEDLDKELSTDDLGDLDDLDELDSTEEDLLPPKLTVEQVQAISADSKLINGFNAYQQAQIIGIMNSYVLKQLKEKGEHSKEEYEAIYNSLQSIFTKRAKHYAASKPLLAKEFKKIVDNFDKFKEQSQERLKVFSVVESKLTGKVGFEDLNSDQEKTNFDDGATFQIDSKDGMSGRLKQFMSFIPNPKKSYIRLEQFMPFDEVVNYLSGQLAGLDADYIDISNKLDELKLAHSWIADVKTLLDSSSNRVKNEFVQWATKHDAGFKIAELQGNKGSARTVKIMDSDQNSVIKVILNKWLVNMKTSSLVKEITPGNLVINNSERSRLAKALQTAPKNDLEAIRSILAEMGIDVSTKALEAVKSNSKKSWEKQFSEGGGIFKTILDKIAKETPKDDESFNTNNPLLDNSGVRQLAYYEAQNSNADYSNSHKSVEGKTIHNYTSNNYFIKQFYRLKHNKANYLNSLLKVGFSSTSAWGKKLNNPNSYFKEVFDYFRVDGFKVGNNTITLAEMSSREHEITKLGLFHNQNNGSKDKGLISHFLAPTSSDKSTAIGITALRHDTKIELHDGGFRLQDSSIDALIDIVDAEYNRIRNSYNIDNTVDGYSPNRFFLFEELNDNEVLWAKMGNNKVLRSSSDSIKLEIRRVLEEHVGKLVEAKKNHWEALGITNKGEYEYIDKDYVKGITSKMRKEDTNGHNIINYMATDYVVNYLIANANMFQLFIGDPAQFWKKGGLEDTWINIGKRLAGEIAPGLELADSKNNKYRQVFVKDASGILAISKNYEQIKELIGEEAAEPFKKIESTDAQEWTTLAEHLYVLEKSGKIDGETIEGILQREEAGTLDKHDFKLIFQPIKPVFVNTQIDHALDLSRKIYIKSSSFPIIKGLSTELDKLRAAMISQKIDRLAFKSATKVGGPAVYDDIFNADGSINGDIKFTSSLELSREGFRIQQDVPFDIEKDKVNRGTQESKLLFANILGLDGFNLNGEAYTGKQLYDKYNEYNKELFSKARIQLLAELQDKEGNLDIEKVQSTLIGEATGREWPINDINALKLINKDEFSKTFALPLWASTSASKIEALLNSIVDNRIRKQKFRGNSFVLGTEEGFRGDSKSIVFTKSYNKETGLLPMRIDKETGKVLPAQILIGNKFKDENGKEIDLKQFIDKDGLLDLSKIDDEILDLFGFRIPSQGHNSMTYVEVVGILPSYMGDLLIAPKDFTKQMGSDFDVDKLYTYMFETVLKDGRLTKKESLKNKILDIHLSVLQHPEVLKQVLQPLGFGKLKFENEKGKVIGLAHDIDKARNARLKTDFQATRLSDQYQKEKYLNARGGKQATGVKSLDSVFTAISQNKNVTVHTTVLDDKGYPIKVPYFLVFGDTNGIPLKLSDISSINSINDNPKIYTVAAYQSAAVDNEKEQILEKINSNNYTFDAERAFAAVGFTEEYIAPLTAQDILFEYSELMSRTQDSVNDEFISKPELVILEELIEKYSKLGGFSADVLESLRDTDYPLTQKELWDSLEHGEQDPFYYKTQIRALVKFNKAREIGKEISNIILSINTDSSGIPSSLIESTFKEVRVNNIQNNPLIANAGNLLVDTINGYATEDALRVNNDLWNRYFPYQSEGIQYIFEEVTKVTGKTQLTNDQQIKLFSEIKSYLYTKVISSLDTEAINDLRSKLFFDSKTNKSLATRIREIQFVSNNPFIIRLITEPDTTGHTPSLIKYNAGASENFDELSVYQGFTDLLTNEKTRELGQDLITYFYLSGGIQQAIQFGKYIPIAYLTNIPFAEQLRDINFKDESLLGVNLHKHDYFDTSDFTRQYLQHNPAQVIQIRDISQIKDVKVNDKGTILSFSTDNTIGAKLLSDQTNPITGTTFPGLPALLSMRDEASKKKFRLYQYIGNGKYVQIDTLGSFGYSEYSQGEKYNRTLIKDNSSSVTIPESTLKTDNRDYTEFQDVEPKQLVENNQVPIDRVLTYSIGQSIEDSMIAISNSTNELHSTYAKAIRELLPNQPKVTTEVIKDKTRGKYTPLANGEGIVKLNPKFIESNEEFEKVILHEYTHHLTSHPINKYEKYQEYLSNKTKFTESQIEKIKEDYNSLSKEQLRVIESLITQQAVLRKKIESNPKWKAEYDEFVRKYEAKEGLDEYSISKNYGAYKLKEFITMVMIDTEFQKILNDIPFSSEKSMLDRFLDLVTKLLGTLGFKINDNSLLVAAIHSSVELISLNNSQAVTETIEDKLPHLEYSKEVIVNYLKTEHIISKKKDGGKYWIFKNTENTNGLEQYRANIDKIYNLIDSDKALYGFTPLVLTRTTNGTIVDIDDSIVARIIELREDGLVDYAPAVKKSIKFQTKINEFQSRINFIKKRIARDKSDRELVSKLTADIKSLQDRITTLEDTDNLADIINYGNTDVKDLSNLLTKDKVSPTDLFYANKIIHQWKEISLSDYIRGPLKDAEGNYSANAQALNSIKNQVAELQDTYVEVFQNAVMEMYKSQGINRTKEEIFAAKKEISALTARMRDISMSEDSLLQLIDRINRTAAFKTEQDLLEEYNKIDTLHDLVKKNALFKQLGFKLFAQENKDGKTGNLVSRFTDSFYVAGRELRDEARKTGPKGWDKYFKWKRANSIVFDLRKLFYDEYQTLDGKQKYSPEVIRDHISDLKKQLGEKGYQRYKDALDKKFKRYQDDLQFNTERINNLEADDSEKASALNEWILENSPFVYAETVYDGVKNKIGKKFINPRGYKYTSEVPRRFTSEGKLTGFYDTKFDQIEANEDLYNFYNHIIDSFNELYEFMPDYVVDDLQHNYLPEIHKNIIEQFSDKGMSQGLVGWYDKVVNQLTTNDISTTSFKERDPVTGEIIRTLPITMLGNQLNAEDKSYDLVKIAKAFSAMAISYKHKSQVEDLVRLSEQVMNQATERQENAEGIHLRDAQGNLISTSNGLKNLRAQVEYAVDAGFYGNRKAIEGISKTKKLLSSDELKTKKILKAKLKEAKEEDKPAIEEEIKALGANVVGSSVWDNLLKFVQLKGMGWNLFAPVNNTVFALISNAIHAAGGQDFNLNEFFWAQGMMLNSVGKSLTLDTLESKQAKKISSLMSLYNVVGEVDQQAYASTVSNSAAGKGIQKLAPLELTKRAEYLNQGTTFLALMKATKVTDSKGVERSLWEAFDENGKWKTEEFGEHPEWTSSKEKMMALKFKLEAIKKPIHGNYDPNSPVFLKKHVLGRAVIMFRSWVTEGFATRFEDEKYDENLQRTRKGRFRTHNILTGGDLGHLKGSMLLLAQMANFFTIGATFKTSLDHLSAVDKANMRKNAAELMIYTTLYLLTLALMHANSDDDKEKMKYNFLMNIGFRVQNDMAFFTSPLAFEKITQSSIPAMSIVTDAAKFFQAVKETVEGKGTYTRGIYRGQSKIKVNLAKNFPLTTQGPRIFSGLMQEPTQ